MQPRTSEAHLPQLDGVRGLAVLIVVLGHLIVFNFGLGINRFGALPPVGVNLFFVLSGFLITGILLKTKDSNQYYKSFYARRALRIWPLYTLVLVLCFAVFNHHLPGFNFDAAKIPWPTFALFLQNLIAPDVRRPLGLEATWSLAVEEQFYLLWPLLVQKCSTKTLTGILIGLIVIAPIARFFAPHFGIDAYVNPVCRFDGMAMGGLIAIWMRMRQPSQRTMTKAIAFGLLFAVMGEACAAKLHLLDVMSKTFVNLGFCALLLASLYIKPVISIMSASWLRYTGTISYGAYLLHALVAAVVLAALGGAEVCRSACSVHS
jgi:peptidoglycan/LPS O-acetylase OafA/YrhL